MLHGDPAAWRAEANSELSKGDAALAQGHFTAAINAYSAALEKGEQLWPFGSCTYMPMKMLHLLCDES